MRAETVDGDGLTLAAERRRPAVSGDGHRRGVLLLHGWPGTRLDWGLVTRRLADDPAFAGVELLVPDLRGYGDSDRPLVDPDAATPFAGASLDAHVADSIAVLDRLGWEEALVGGYDIGANVAQALARRLPGRVAGLVLCNPVHPVARVQAATLRLERETWYQQLHLQPWAADLVAHDRATVEVYLRHFYTHWWGAGAVPEAHFRQIVDAYARPGAFDASIGWYRARAEGPAQDAAPEVLANPLATPTSILWGERDPVTPVVFADTVEQSFADCTLQRLPDVGHFGPLEAPDQLHAVFGALAERLGWRG